MRRITILFAIVFYAAYINNVSAQNTYPRVFVLNKKLLEANKSRISKEDPTLIPAYKQLMKDADKALKEGPFSVMVKKNNPPSGDMHDYMSLAPYFWPDSTKPGGLPYIRKDGQTNPEVKDYNDKDNMPKMIASVQSLALAYYFSNNEKYAQHASVLLKKWFLDPATKMNPNLNYAQAIKGVNAGRGAGIIDARHFLKIVDAIGLLQNSEQWKKENQEGMQKWFGQFLNWMQTSTAGIDESDAPNNHGTWYDALRLSLALFIADTRTSKEIVESAKQRLDQQMDETGKFPKELERTIALHYSAFNLEAFFLIAEMAEHISLDLWNYTSPKGRSLRKGFDVLKPYLTNQKQWEGTQIKDFDFEEDAYPLLMIASPKLGCKDCKDALNKLPGKKESKLRFTLLY